MKKIIVFILIILFTGVFLEVGFTQQNYMNIKVNNKNFTVVLEKYCYLDFVLPTDSKSVRYIKKGDVMLFGNNCLVIFYKSFTTSYGYTKIGYIKNSNDIEQVLGKSTIEAIFEK